MKIKKTIAIALTVVMSATVLVGLAGCNGGTKMSYKEAIFSTGLTPYASYEEFIAAEGNAITKEEAFSQVVILSGNFTKNRLDDEEITKQLGFLTDSEVNEANRESLAIANKLKYVNKGTSGKINTADGLSGADAAFAIVAAMGYGFDVEPENAVSLYTKYAKPGKEAKAAANSESLTVGGFYAMIYSMLLSYDEGGNHIGSKLVLDYSVDEITAYKAGIADGVFAVRLTAAANELNATDISGIVGANLAEKRVELLSELYSAFTATNDKTLKTAVSVAKKALNNAGKKIDKVYSGIKKGGVAELSSALNVEDRNVVASTLTEKAATVTKTDKTVVLENAYSKFVFDISSFALTSYYNYEVKSELLTERAKVFSFNYNGTEYDPSNCTLVSTEITENGNVKTVVFTFSAANGDLTPVVTITMDNTLETKFDFIIKNNTGDAVTFTPVFPDMGTLKIGEDPVDDWYMYPRKGGIISNKRVTLSGGLKATYGSGVTFPVISLYQLSGGGSYFMLQNDFLQVKELEFVKDPRYGSTISVSYPERDILADETWTCATMAIGSHSGDWYNAICAYRAYVDTWYDFQAESDALDGNIQFKQVFVKQGVQNKELADAEKSPSELVEQIFELGNRFGGYDTLHWFDWWDNLGDYNYYSVMGGKQEMREVADVVHSLGKKYSLYTEGILANTYSNVYLEYGEEIYRLTKDGKHQNPDTSFSCTCLKSVYKGIYMDNLLRIASDLPVDILYLDQFANQIASECYNPQHDHQDHYCVLAGQIEFLQELRENLDEIREGIAIGGEYPMSDYGSQFTSYVFTYNNSIWYTGLDGVSAKPTADLYTFLFPEVKLYNITIAASKDASYDEDNNAASAYYEALKSLKLVFFNGEGRWHDEGYTGWSDDCIEFVNKSMTAVAAFEDVFMGTNKTPLLYTDNDSVFVNRFASEDESTVIFTVLNNSPDAVENVTFTLENAADYSFFDILNDKAVDYSVNGNKVTVKITVAADDVVGIAAIK